MTYQGGAGGTRKSSGAVPGDTEGGGAMVELTGRQAEVGVMGTEVQGGANDSTVQAELENYQPKADP